jgi:hypothetical protein
MFLQMQEKVQEQFQMQTDAMLGALGVKPKP